MLTAAIGIMCFWWDYPTWEQTASSLEFAESGVKWRMDSRMDSVEGFELGDRRYAVYLFRNGKKVGTYLTSDNDAEPAQVLPPGTFIRAGIPKVRAPFPVVAVRCHTGNGHGQSTLFIGFKNGRAFQMGYGSDAGEVGGPINYGGRSDLWLFDDYSWYGHYGLTDTMEPLHRLLYRIGKDGKLRFVRKWLAPVRKRLPDTVGITF